VTGATSSRSPGVALRLDGVCRVFENNLVVIDHLSLLVETGEFLAILGPSGCGKSTLLRLIARLAEPDGGSITLTPDDVPFQTAFVFQDAHLLPWRNVLDNVALPLELMGEAPDSRRQKARDALDQVSLLDGVPVPFEPLDVSMLDGIHVHGGAADGAPAQRIREVGFDHHAQIGRAHV